MLASKGLRAVIVLSFLFSFCPFLYGQATGSISGIISDSTGASVPGAKVTATAPATGQSRSSLTNDTGEFVIPSLGVASYDIVVEKEGFPNATAADVRLQVDEHRALDFKLSPASVTTAVEVSACFRKKLRRSTGRFSRKRARNSDRHAGSCQPQYGSGGRSPLGP